MVLRGTEFWGGPIDAKYGVLLREGEVSVSNQAGSVTLSGHRHRLAARSAGHPAVWPAEKAARAIETVTMR
jgi:hypothetical protein